MKKDASKILLRLAAVFCGLFFAVQAETLPFKNYTTSEGLAHDTVNEIVRDSRGFLWFCTGEGLSRFDGYEFKNYTQAHGLPHRSVNDLLELEDGIYLVATSDGLAIFDPKGAVNPADGEPSMFRVLRIPFETDDRRAISVSDLHKTRAGEIWAATGVGLYHVVAGEFRLERLESEAWRGQYNEVISIGEDRFGRLWLGMSIGLKVINPQNGEYFNLSASGGGLSFIEDDEGRIWTGGGINPANPGLNVYETPDASKSPVHTRQFTTADGLTDNSWIHALLKTSEGRVLAGIRNGLNEFLPEAHPGEPSFRTLFKSDLLSVSEDAGGNFWLGTSTKGAFKLTRRGFTLYETEEKPPYSGITSIFAGEAPNEIFAASSLADLLRFDGEKFSKIEVQGLKTRNWSRNQLDLRSRVDGEWWMPSIFGLARFGKVEKFEDLARAVPKKIYTKADGLVSDAVFNLFEDSRGDIWISFIDGGKDSLMRWERQTEKFYIYTTDDGLPDTNAPTAFAEDLQGSVWFGFYAGGAARYRNGKFQLFSARKGFPTGYVGAIHVDRQGRVWIGTGNGGAVRFDNPAEDEPRYTILNVGSGLSSNQANCITEDNFGRIYIGTARGINRVEPETGRIKLYTSADGLPGSTIGRCARDGEGNLWFSQKFTLARLRVQADEKTLAPPIFIGDLKANGERVGKLSELGETSVENLELQSEQRQIEISFFALGFATGETLRYQYRLADGEWSAPSAQRTVNLSLSPGSYRFEVRAVNAEGVTSENPARVSFAIARPVWLRWWFLLIVAAALSASIYMLYRYRVNQIIKLERVRTRIATDLHDDIGSSLSKIAILSEVVRQKNGAEENGKFEPLEIIANTSREMVDTMSDIVWAINPERDHLSDLIQRMRRFAEEMLDAAEIEYEFADAENLKDIRLGADLRREIYLIFKECVNNLAKHSQATKAEFDIRLENECLIVEIKDNGRGFVAEELRAETSSAYSADIGDAGLRSFGGNGLRNMRRRAENLGGEFVIDSEVGRGTQIQIKIPVGKKLFAA